MQEVVPLAIDCPACRFGRFELQPAQRRLLADGHPVPLGSRAFDMLVVLVARAGKLVTKHDLLTLVWSGLVVEENNLQVQASTLRKLLGPNALLTIPGRGYRFGLPVVRADASVAGDAQEGTLAPPKAAAAAPVRAPTNLPPRIARLYGRAHDVAAVMDLLMRHAVVTVVGAGGIGKTRLAQAVAAQVAAESAAEVPDGVWWVELAPLTDGALVASAIARVLGTQLATDRAPVATLAAVLASQRALLVLDNCEHLIDAVAPFVETVSATAPGVRILITSQETLKTADEGVYRVGALAVPADPMGADAPEAGAVALFVARAQGVDPRFVLTPANAPAVVEICRRLDGIPLAIELAAARLPLLGVEGLRTRLDERFNVLTAGARVVLRRHQTLRATLEWSYSLLTTEEQTVLRRLGVFAGSFTLEAAQHVIQDERIDAWAALDHLGALVDKSLVLAEGELVPRYRLLETTRAYALERLGEAHETEAMLRRHADALRQVLATFESDDLLTDLARLAHNAAAAELDNLRAALSWVASADGEGERALALAGNSLRVWIATVQLREGMDRCLALRDRIDTTVAPAVSARFWLTVAQLGLYSTRREAYDAATLAADLYRQLGDERRLFTALIARAVQGIRFGTIAEMKEAIAEAEALARPEWPARERASLEFARTRLFARQGHWADALAAARRQVIISEAGGSELGRHYAMSNVVAAEIALGQTEVALAHAQASIARLDAIGGGAGAGHLWIGVLNAKVLLGDVEAALAAGRTAYALLLREGDELRVLVPLALCAAMQGRLADAVRILGFAESTRARDGAQPEVYWSSVKDRLHTLVSAGFDLEEQARLRAEGAALPDVVAWRLALGTP